MKRPIIGLALTGALAFGTLDRGAESARAQVPGESVVYETVAPAQRTVTYGERTKVKYRGRKTIIKEKPVAYISRTPAVVRETRYYQPAPVVENVMVQPAPVIESRYITQDPVIRTRYLSPYPY